jgi:glycosyltransferase involved in cell wall biosynthesis
MRLKVLIVSSHKIKCGVANYTDTLSSLLDAEFDVSIAALDQSILRREERHVVRAGDRHIKAICAQFKDYDVVNIQWEPGLLGRRHKDIARRFPWLLAAAKRLILTAHSVMPFPDRTLLGNILFARRHGWRALRDRLRDEALPRRCYAAIRKRARAGHFALVAHTERDRRYFRDVIGIQNTFDHPTSHIHAGWRRRIERDTPTARKELEQLFPGKRKFIGVFGFLSEYKGIATAIKATQYLDEDCQLLIYGGVHPDQIRPWQAINPYLQELVEELERKPAGASELDPSPALDRVAFLGAPDDYDFVLATSAVDVCVFPYLEVGQSASGPAVTAIELGKPTVLTRTHHFIEFEKYFPEHFEMVDIGNYIELAQTIQHLTSEHRAKPPLAYNSETLAQFYGDLIRRCAGEARSMANRREHELGESEQPLPVAAE